MTRCYGFAHLTLYVRPCVIWLRQFISILYINEASWWWLTRTALCIHPGQFIIIIISLLSLALSQLPMWSIARACGWTLPPPRPQCICQSFMHLPQWCLSSECRAYISVSATQSSTTCSGNTQMQGEGAHIITCGQTSTMWSLQLMHSLVAAVCIGIGQDCWSYLAIWCPWIYTMCESKSSMCFSMDLLIGHVSEAQVRMDRMDAL